MTTRQDCSRCPQLRKCWNMSQSPSDAALVINLLVCRLKLGIKPNRTTKVLLRMLRPKIVKTAEWIRNTVDPIPVDFEELVIEIESATIESILSDYEMGERAWPLHYLFGHPSGIRGWAMRYANRLRRDAYTHYSCDYDDLEAVVSRANYAATRGRIVGAPMDYETPDYAAALDAKRAPQPHKAVLDKVDDGVTLSLSEYRVIRFCLSHAGTFTIGRPSPVSGLQQFLAAQTRVKRRSINRYYRNASYKLIELAGLTDNVLADRGVVAPEVDAERRARWLFGCPTPTDQLTPDELYGLLNTPRAGATLVDLCWAYGINDRAYYKIRERYSDMTLAQIKGTLSNDDTG